MTTLHSIRVSSSGVGRASSGCPRAGIRRVPHRQKPRSRDLVDELSEARHVRMAARREREEERLVLPVPPDTTCPLPPDETLL